MKKPILAIDIDDVLANSTESLRLVVNKHAGVNLSPKHYKVPADGYRGYYDKVWSAHNVQVTMGELKPQMAKDQLHVKPQVHAQKVLSELKKSYMLVVVTARDPEWKAATLRWLDAHFHGVFEKVLFSAEVREGETPKTKGQLCKAAGVSWLIDDNVDHAKSALAEGIQVVLFGTYGWHYDVPEHVVRCGDWQAVQEHFKKVAV